MANLYNELKTTFLKGMESFGKAASSLASGAQEKLQEMNVDARRRQVMDEIPDCALDLWKQGAELPEALSQKLSELNDLNEQLAAMRAAREKAQPEPEKAEDLPVEEAADDIASEAEPPAEEEAPAEAEPAPSCAEEPQEAQ